MKISALGLCLKDDSCTMDTDLFERSWQAEEFIYGVDGHKEHGGHGYAPADEVSPVREDVLIILQAG